MGRMMHGVTPEDKLTIVYKAEDIRWMRKKYRIGQRILIIEPRVDGEMRVNPKQRWYTVVKRYKHHLSCIDDYGHRESFNYFDLEKLVVKCK